MALTLSVFLYAGFLGSIAGAAVWLLRAYRGKSTGKAAIVAIAGNLALAVALLWPPRESHAAAPPVSKLDSIVPVWQFDERHTIEINASPAAIDKAIRDVTAGEIRLFQLLTGIRRGGERQGEDILNVPDQRPILSAAITGGFLVLSDEPQREIVFGAAVTKPAELTLTAEQLRRWSEPGVARAIVNFRIESTPGVSNRQLLTTETRVHATDSLTARKFSWYWRMIYPGSSLIRVGWLDAIKKRAESAPRT